MAETTNALAALSDNTAQLVERTARSVVAVHSGGRWPASGIHWRSGIVVTAEEVLERDENIGLSSPAAASSKRPSLGEIRPPMSPSCAFSPTAYQ